MNLKCIPTAFHELDLYNRSEFTQFRIHRFLFCFNYKFFLEDHWSEIELCIRRVYRALYFHASFGDLNRIWSYRQRRKFKVKVYFTQQCSWWCSSQEVLVKKTKKKKVVFSSFDCESKECLLFMVKSMVRRLLCVWKEIEVLVKMLISTGELFYIYTGC